MSRIIGGLVSASLNQPTSLNQPASLNQRDRPTQHKGRALSAAEGHTTRVSSLNPYALHVYP